jgi:threonine dehydrogenase-like Zn-dependent dehydrogenase
MTVAASLKGPRALVVGPFTLPPPGPHEVRIDVAACAICATDLHAWDRGRPAGAPGATGHEIAGVVTEVGTEVGGFAPGARVCVEPSRAMACGRCAHCVRGLAFFCTDQQPVAAWGFGEAMTLPATAAIPVPDEVPTSVAALAEPMACAVHAIRQSATAVRGGGQLDGIDVAIVGAGPLGLMAVLAARRAGAARIRVVARHEQQREAARRFGGEVVGEDLADLRDAPPDLVIVAAGGSDQLLAGALGVVAVAGEVVVLGLARDPQTIDARRAVLRGLRVLFSIGYGGDGDASDFAHALAVLALQPTEAATLLTHRFPLADVADAFALAADTSRPSLRVLVEPGARQ